MKYVVAYIQACFSLFIFFSPIFISMLIFTGLNNLVALYLSYLILVVGLGGVVGKWIRG